MSDATPTTHPRIEHVLDRPIASLTNWNWEKALYIILIVLALATRLYGLGDRVQSHDESIHTRYSWNLYSGRGFAHDPLMHGPSLFEITALSYFLFGDNDTSARVPVALIGVAMVAFPYLLRRWLGRTGALVTAFLLLISPAVAFYSRYIRHDVPIAFLSLLTAYAAFAYLRDGRDRWLYWMAAAVALAFATKEDAFIFNALLGFFLVGLFVIQALGREWRPAVSKPLFLISLLVAALGLLTLALGMTLKPDGQALPAWWALAGGALAGVELVTGVAMLLIGSWHHLREHRSFGLVVVLGTLCLPNLAAFLIKAAGLEPLEYTAPTIYYSMAITGAMIAVSAAAGLWWDTRRWLIAAAIYYAIFIVLFTTFFTNGYGIASGLVGSLGYWLKQQGVRRGDQPDYYYVVMVFFYEYLPWLLSALAIAYLAGRAALNRLRALFVDAAGAHAPDSLYFIAFLVWWDVAAWIGYAIAGEKMPWLTVHITLPMILLSGWLLGRFLDGVRWRELLRQRAWLVALLLAPLLFAVVVLVRSAAARPFAGLRLAELQVTGQFIGALVGSLALGGGLAYLAYRVGWRMALRVALLTLLLVPMLLTVHTAWQFCYVNYDYPVEPLVYAHSGPGVHVAMRQVEELSRRLYGHPNLIPLAYGADASTVFYWQLRNFPSATFFDKQPSREQMDVPVVIAGRDQWEAVDPYLRDRYLVQTLTFLWWPLEDYRGLTWDRIAHVITDTQTQTALWDIWYKRDYTRYGEVTRRPYTVDKWPLRHDFRLYVRKDVAQQMWDLSTSEPTELEAAVATDPYPEGWLDLEARLVFGSEGAGPGQFQNPRAIAVDKAGFVYVADTSNHRIQKFTSQGEFVASWGHYSPADIEAQLAQGFNEPWGVAVAANGDIYVADTWNYRIQRLSAEGEVLDTWGAFGQYRVGAVGSEYAFYGPRGLAIDESGRVFVTDTGNKRIAVYEPDGTYVLQWGGGGIAEGYLDEPVGIAIGPKGEVYVADTWNQRIQVFDQRGQFLRQWPIAGWGTGSVEDKPYLAVDRNGYVYVTDPSHSRVLVFDSWGNYALSFGQYGFDGRSLAYPNGIAVDDGGSIYVVDARGNRVLVFAPLELGMGHPGVLDGGGP